MAEWQSLGKMLLSGGLIVASVGALLLFGDRIPWVNTWFGWLGKLPGDVAIKRDQFSFYFPVVTSLVLSVLLSLLFFLVSWLFRR
ncbi:MAG TPA: DUF2905 domain-containing protein [Nitrospiraceae bacterium]